MLVYNLTDIPTPQLAIASLVNVSICVDGVIIKPGTSADVKKLAHGELQRFFMLDALSLSPSPDYMAAKAAAAVQPNAKVGVLPIAEAVDEEPSDKGFSKKK